MGSHIGIGFGRFLRPIAIAVVVLLGFSLIPGAPAFAESSPRRPKVQKMRSVPGRKVPVKPRSADPAEKAALRTSPRVSWPRSGNVELDPGTRGSGRPGGLPVSLTPVVTKVAGHSRSGTPSRVRVEVLDQRTARRAGVPGVLLRVGRADERTEPARVSLTVDYAAFRQAYGGDWESRLTLMPLPECALTTPGKRGCAAPGASRAPSTDGSVRHRGTTVTREVTLAGGTPGRQERSSQGALFALAATASGGAGDHSATSLSPSATWNVNTQTGDFSWTHPMRTPPPPGGPTPQVGLVYASGGVDGRTASTNNQPSWVGEGFDFWPGFIERKYKPCAEDGQSATGDQCWSHDNATMSLNGRATELIKDDATGAWRPKADDGSRIERLTEAANGTHGGEHWKVTTPDGVQYFFGLNRLPGWSAGKPETRSAWTVPVYGDDAGEPCHKGGFADSWCQQGWRWNLDYVVDTRDSAMTYFYEPETNYYGRNGDAAAATSYIRGGHLTRIGYGQRADRLFIDPAPGRVDFAAGDRCISGTSCTGQPQNWPDTPWDQACGGGSCPGKYSPTFWTGKRLAKVTTMVWDGRSDTADAYRAVDSWELTHTYPVPGDDTTASLWLASIKHTGHVGGSSTMPEINFDGVQLLNRVDAAEGLPPMWKWRIRSVISEAGGETRVNYSGRDCERSRLPAPDSNSRRCFPHYWSPPGVAKPVEDWFHKYVVEQVQANNRTAGGAIQQTAYDYLDTPAWHYDDDDGLTQPRYKTWSQWRGYSRVRVRGGADGGPQTATESLFLRGMHGDRLASGARRDVKVADSWGGQTEDHHALNGFVREVRTFNGSSGSEVAGTINDAWLKETAARTMPWGVSTAHRHSVGKSRTRTALSGGRAPRITEMSSEFDEYGLPKAVNDAGDVSTGDDDRCVRTSYARNTDRWMLGTVSRVETVAVGCGSDVDRPEEVISDVRAAYDGKDVGDAPERGDVTAAQRLSGWNDGILGLREGPKYLTVGTTRYDHYGRAVETTDAAGKKTTTSYAPASGPLTGFTVTNPLGHTTTTELDPAWGAAVATVDANGRRTDLAYDALGRLSKVWQPGREKTTQTPSAMFEYRVRNDAPTAVISKKLRNDETYLSSYALFDGLFRPRQTQTPAAAGTGRILTDTFYDSRGLVTRSYGAYYNSAEPGIDLLAPDDNAIPALTQTSYDGAGRPETSVFMVEGTEKWRTSTSYGGDWVAVDPPEGATPTATITDVRGRTVELRHYKGAGPEGDHDATRYTYTRRGETAAVTDPAGNRWRYEYDLRGRTTTVHDPDKGETAYSYNDLDQVTTTTDARGTKLWRGYDDLGRPTAMRQGSGDGPLLVSWSYDTLAKGLPTSATRHAGPHAYVSAVTGYDTLYRPTGTKVTIPAAEGPLAGDYLTSAGYNLDGSLASETYPAAGGLAKEKVIHTYSPSGLPKKTYSAAGHYVSDSLYSRFGEPLQNELTADGEYKTWRTFDYENGTRRLERAQTTRDSELTSDSDVRYRYDDAGTITRIADTPLERPRDVQCFTHDHLRRLTEAWTATDNCAGAPNAQVVGGPAPYWHGYTYDKTGNRLSEIRHGLSGAADTTRTSAYPAPGPDAERPHALQKATTTGPSGPRNDSYAYDQTGNTTTRNIGGTEQKLEWDAEGHLATVTEGSKTTSFLYDATGSRLIRRDPAGTTLYLGTMELRFDRTSNTVKGTRYYSHGGAGAAVRTPGQLTFLTGDHQGTAQLAIDATTGSLSQRRFTPFGEPRGQTPRSWPDEHTFVGGVNDSSTGLTHLGAREYDPAAGRFISVDPVMDPADPQQMNGYSYANNNPITFDDASGMIVCKLGGCHEEETSGGGSRSKDFQTKKNYQHERDLESSWESSSSSTSGVGHGATLVKHGSALTILVGPNGLYRDLTRNSNPTQSAQALARDWARDNNDPSYRRIAGYGVVAELFGGDIQGCVQGSVMSCLSMAPAPRMANAVGGVFALYRDLRTAEVVGSKSKHGGRPAGLPQRDPGSHVSIPAEVKGVNPTGGGDNCIAVCIATDHRLAGRHSATASLNKGPFKTKHIERYAGAPLSHMSGPAQIEQILMAAGEGARGIVFVDNGEDSIGHGFNAIHRSGRVQFIDGQKGRPLTGWGDYANVFFVRTN